METVLVYCPNCEVCGQIEVSFIGRKIKCRECHISFILTEEGDVIIAPTEPVVEASAAIEQKVVEACPVVEQKVAEPSPVVEQKVTAPEATVEQKTAAVEIVEQSVAVPAAAATKPAKAAASKTTNVLPAAPAQIVSLALAFCANIEREIANITQRGNHVIGDEIGERLLQSDFIFAREALEAAVKQGKNVKIELANLTLLQGQLAMAIIGVTKKTFFDTEATRKWRARAEKAFRESLKISPTAAAGYQLAQLFLLEKRDEDALATFRQLESAKEEAVSLRTSKQVRQLSGSFSAKALQGERALAVAHFLYRDIEEEIALIEERANHVLGDKIGESLLQADYIFTREALDAAAKQGTQVKEELAMLAFLQGKLAMAIIGATKKMFFDQEVTVKWRRRAEEALLGSLKQLPSPAVSYQLGNLYAIEARDSAAIEAFKKAESAQDMEVISAPTLSLRASKRVRRLSSAYSANALKGERALAVAQSFFSDIEEGINLIQKRGSHLVGDEIGEHLLATDFVYAREALDAAVKQGTPAKEELAQLALLQVSLALAIIGAVRNIFSGSDIAEKWRTRAEEYLREGLRLSPSPEANYLAGNFYAMEKRDEEALTAFRAAEYASDEQLALQSSKIIRRLSGAYSPKALQGERALAVAQAFFSDIAERIATIENRGNQLVGDEIGEKLLATDFTCANEALQTATKQGLKATEETAQLAYLRGKMAQAITAAGKQVFIDVEITNKWREIAETSFRQAEGSANEEVGLQASKRIRRLSSGFSPKALQGTRALALAKSFFVDIAQGISEIAKRGNHVIGDETGERLLRTDFIYAREALDAAAKQGTAVNCELAQLAELQGKLAMAIISITKKSFFDSETTTKWRQRAEECFREAQKLHPTAEVSFQLGQFYSRESRPKEAAAAFKQVEKTSKDEELRLQASILLRRLNM